MLLTRNFDVNDQQGLIRGLLEYASSFQEKVAMLRVWVEKAGIAG